MRSKTIKLGAGMGSIFMLKGEEDREATVPTTLVAYSPDADCIVLSIPLKKLWKLAETCRQMAGEIEAEKSSVSP